MGQSIAKPIDDFRQDIASVDPHRADPRQMIEADLLDEHPFRRHSEMRGDLSLEVDRDVA